MPGDAGHGRPRRILKLLRRVWIAAGITATVVFVSWSLWAYRADATARRAALGGAGVRVERAAGFRYFVPANAPRHRASLLFFPGALVDPRAYAPLAMAVARAGFPSVIVELPRRGAFGGADSPELDRRIRAALATLGPDALPVVGGHSRGGVVAARVAAEGSVPLRGLVLVGTSHPRDFDLGNLDVPVLKIVGTRDGLASPAEVRRNAPLLPSRTEWLWIRGGNHSQFGWYGFQPLDRRPGIGAAEQRRIMTGAVLQLLAAVDSQAGSPAAGR